MKRYRIKQGQGYHGCIPITVYWVQVRKETFFDYRWENVKGFDQYDRAKALLEALE